MTQHNAIKLFETKKVRTIWDDKEEKWYFSIVDVVAVLTDSPNPRKYWSVLKTRLKKEGSELTTNCSQLKMKSADGKMYLTDVADTQQLLRLIQSIPSTWSDMTAKEYKQFKGLKKENLRDNMTNKELVLNMLAELSTKEISESKNPETFREHMDVAEAGGEIARNARMELEAKTGKAVISPLNAKTGIALNSSPEEEDTKE